MLTEEAKYWLQQRPGSRPATRYLKDRDEIVTEYVPQLGARHVTRSWLARKPGPR